MNWPISVPVRPFGLSLNELPKHSQGGQKTKSHWIPAFAGVTMRKFARGYPWLRLNCEKYAENSMLWDARLHGFDQRW